MNINMINNILGDLNQFYNEKISPAQLFSTTPYFKVKPIRFDIVYLPRANRFEIGFGRLRKNSNNKEQQLFLLTHEICHIAQRENFQQNLRYTNLGLDWEELINSTQIEKEVLGLQYSLYEKMNWDTSIFEWLPFRTSPKEIGRPIDLTDFTKTFKDFENLMNEKLETLVSKA